MKTLFITPLNERDVLIGKHQQERDSGVLPANDHPEDFSPVPGHDPKQVQPG